MVTVAVFEIFVPFVNVASALRETGSFGNISELKVDVDGGALAVEFLIVTLVTCVVFTFCFAVFILKSRREGGPPRLHRCGDGPDCHCYGKDKRKSVDLLDHVDAPSCGHQAPRVPLK